MRKGTTYGISNLFIYDLKNKKWLAQAYEEEKKDMPAIELMEMGKFLQSLGKTYLDREYQYSLYEDYPLEGLRERSLRALKRHLYRYSCKT